MKPAWRRSGLIYLVILIGAIILFFYILPRSQEPEQITLTEAIALSQTSGISKIEVDGDQLIITTTEGSERTTFKEANTSLFDIEGLNLTGVEVEVKGSTGIDWGQIFLNFLPLENILNSFRFSCCAWFFSLMMVKVTSCSFNSMSMRI